MKAIAREDRGLPARIAGDIGRRITIGELKAGDTLPQFVSELLEMPRQDS